MKVFAKKPWNPLLAAVIMDGGSGYNIESFLELDNQQVTTPPRRESITPDEVARLLSLGCETPWDTAFVTLLSTAAPHTRRMLFLTEPCVCFSASVQFVPCGSGMFGMSTKTVYWRGFRYWKRVVKHHLYGFFFDC